MDRTLEEKALKLWHCEMFSLEIFILLEEYLPLLTVIVALLLAGVLHQGHVRQGDLTHAVH